MGGVVALIDAIGGVDVVLDKSVSDPYYWVNSHTQGVYFPAGRNHFDGARALIFARTRKGDTDWARAARQQQLVLATIGRVLDRGTTKLSALAELGIRYVRTDLPLDKAPAVFRLLKAADVAGAKGVVLGPPTYARHIPGGTDYELKMDVVRALVANLFAPAPGSPITQTASPVP
jgi:anionic cell wall polymer biosynthesis LytR-Cps2A-Psr (LCP) family protein